MLKNKFKIVALILTIILFLTTPFCLADDDVYIDTEDAAENVVNEDQTEVNEENNNDSSDFKKSDVYLTGQDVKIDYVVDGNVFVVAENVTISSQIGGDAFICAKNITIDKEGYIFSNLFAAANDVTIEGVVYDVFAAANNITVSGFVYRDMKAVANTLNIYGTVGRNAFVDVEKLNFTRGNEDSEDYVVGAITGDLNYSSKSEAEIPEGVIGGKANFTKVISNENSTSASDYIVSALSFIALAVAIWLLSLWLAPKFLKNTEKLISKRILAVIGFGILGLITIPIISIVLLCVGIASVALPLLLLYILLLLISVSVFIIAITNVLCTKLKIEKKLLTFCLLVGVSLVVWLIKLIPVVGGLVSFAAMLLGLGILITNILPHKEKEA